MKWIFRIFAGLIVLAVLCVVALWLAGLRPGAGHSAAEVTIDRPPAQVFRWLTDDDRLKKWLGGLVEIHQISAGSGGGEIGKKFRMTEVYKGESVQMEVITTSSNRTAASPSRFLPSAILATALQKLPTTRSPTSAEKRGCASKAQQITSVLCRDSSSRSSRRKLPRNLLKTCSA